MPDTLVAIVTGGSQGIGAAICIELLKNGYRVCIADIQELKAIEFTNEQKSVYGEENITTICCDVSKESDYISLFEKTLKKFKRVDVLINNAGIILEENPRKCLEVNLLGTLIGCHTALKYMGKSKGGNGGTVINMSSSAGSHLPAYTASKNGIIGLTRSFGHPHHYDKDGIIFAALCPFAVDTDLLKSAIKNVDPTSVPMDIFTDVMSPEFTAKGVMKILEDKINGSTLAVLPDAYHYVKIADKLQNLFSKA
ncbi:unnamed protein product [Larinioides sclopetarius]|uniref:15-hydroxyprostaglandin dehydrogenase [NAD(+)] n=1 Tax=Larinioides sclopetarius TaxID=280406 RepID=A0AAV2B9K7_9ARAC